MTQPAAWSKGEVQRRILGTAAKDKKESTQQPGKEASAQQQEADKVKGKANAVPLGSSNVGKPAGQLNDSGRQRSPKAGPQQGAVNSEADVLSATSTLPATRPLQNSDSITSPKSEKGQSSSAQSSAQDLTEAPANQSQGQAWPGKSPSQPWSKPEKLAVAMPASRPVILKKPQFGSISSEDIEQVSKGRSPRPVVPLPPSMAAPGINSLQDSPTTSQTAAAIQPQQPIPLEPEAPRRGPAPATHSAPAALAAAAPGGDSTAPASSPMDAPVALDSALRTGLFDPKRRMFLLRLEQTLLAFIKSPDVQTMELDPMNSYFRLIAHKLAHYYNLGHTSNPGSAAVTVFKRAGARQQTQYLYTMIPGPDDRVADMESPSPASSSGRATPTTKKNKPRLLVKGKSNPPDSELASLSLSGHSTPNTDNPMPTPQPIEESDSGIGENEESVPKGLGSFERREAAYLEARARIFENFGESQDDDQVYEGKWEYPGDSEVSQDPEYSRDAYARPPPRYRPYNDRQPIYPMPMMVPGGGGGLVPGAVPVPGSGVPMPPPGPSTGPHGLQGAGVSSPGVPGGLGGPGGIPAMLGGPGGPAGVPGVPGVPVPGMPGAGMPGVIPYYYAPYPYPNYPQGPYQSQ